MKFSIFCFRSWVTQISYSTLDVAAIGRSGFVNDEAVAHHCLRVQVQKMMLRNNCTAVTAPGMTCQFFAGEGIPLSEYALAVGAGWPYSAFKIVVFY
jgi:hypothetical protein